MAGSGVRPSSILNSAWPGPTRLSARPCSPGRRRAGLPSSAQSRPVLWFSASSPAECSGFPAQSPAPGRTPPPHCLQSRGTALPAPKRPCFPSLYPPPARPLDSGSAPRRLPESDSAPRRLPDLAPPSPRLFGSGSAPIRFLDSTFATDLLPGLWICSTPPPGPGSSFEASRLLSYGPFTPRLDSTLPSSPGGIRSTPLELALPSRIWLRPVRADFCIAPPLDSRPHPPIQTPPPLVLAPPTYSRSPPLLPSEEAVPSLGPRPPSGRRTVLGQVCWAAGALRNVMQCFGVRRPSRRLSRSRELYLQEQSRKVAALNGQRLGKGFRGPEIRGGWEGSWGRTQTVCLGAWTCLVLL